MWIEVIVCLTTPLPCRTIVVVLDAGGYEASIYLARQGWFYRGGYERAFLFSCGYFCAESHCGGRGGSQGKRHRTQQTQRFQSDPPRVGTRIGAERVYGRPAWTACGTRIIGRIPQYGKRARRKQPSVGFARRRRGQERAPCRFHQCEYRHRGRRPGRPVPAELHVRGVFVAD